MPNSRADTGPSKMQSNTWDMSELWEVGADDKQGCVIGLHRLCRPHEVESIYINTHLQGIGVARGVAEKIFIIATRK